eukprot:TRINITY_DN827_c0_g1_i1.p1 TRINITY_DN827_c0_g1~~TRINITY_DN827_c0_g1_i1.p1  ORF type:complete len:164 (+),score=11.06 TRINITY_DN827_c0_g1_i1:47-493(+)
MDGQDYFVLESGAVDVFVFDQFRETIKPGWCFGELSFVFGTLRSASCIASADSVLWVLSRHAFDDIVMHSCATQPLSSSWSKLIRSDTDLEDGSCNQDKLTILAIQQTYGDLFFQDEDASVLSKDFLEPPATCLQAAALNPSSFADSF